MARTTVITLVLVVAILVWIYRSPVAPLVPLTTIGVAFAVSLGVISFLAQAGLKVSALVETFMVVIVLGAGTDYCLFIVSRYKEELAEHGEAAPDPGRHHGDHRRRHRLERGDGDRGVRDAGRREVRHVPNHGPGHGHRRGHHPGGGPDPHPRAAAHPWRAGVLAPEGRSRLPGRGGRDRGDPDGGVRGGPPGPASGPPPAKTAAEDTA